jgi:ABC-2 type transport system permease protein
MRALVFAQRNAKEILRDPLSYVFCLGLPICMLVAFYVMFYSKTTPWFAIDTLAPGIAVFSFAFVMLYMALLVSKDRATAFLSRLYVSPMTKVDFVLGYTIPGLAIAFVKWLLAS